MVLRSRNTLPACRPPMETPPAALSILSALPADDTVEPSRHAGEATVAVRSAEVRALKFYSSWTCPYSQRVWIGLEEKVVDYQWVEVDLFRESQGQGKWLLPVEELRSRYPEFLAASPKGKLPTLEHGEHILQNSLIILEYLHEIFGGAPLLPPSPYLRAKVRLWTRHVEDHIVPHYNTLLSAPDPGMRAQARAWLMEGLLDFEAAMAPESEGPFFLGDDFSAADIALAPFWQRMVSVLRAYRKFDPTACPRLQVWFEAVESRPSFQRTAIDPEKLIEQFSDCTDREESVPLRRVAADTVPLRRGGGARGTRLGR